MKDGVNSANRYYLNRFKDAYRQAVIGKKPKYFSFFKICYSSVTRVSQKPTSLTQFVFYNILVFLYSASYPRNQVQIFT